MAVLIITEVSQIEGSYSCMCAMQSYIQGSKKKLWDTWISMIIGENKTKGPE